MNYMGRALELAQHALGTTSPNPAVGAVVVLDGRFVGEGFTQPPGQAHAEIVALRQAGDLARGATLYITLEPCCHFGRTPPCTQAIIAAGVKEVHFAMIDPNPRVAGQGKSELEGAGIEIVVGEEAEAAQRVNEAYLKYIVSGQPFVTAKFAASLDGRIATHTGDSRWITSEAARRQANRLRAMSDAVIVGVGTVLTDDPLLTARDEGDRPLARQPLRIVVDSSGRTPASARMLQENGRVLIATTGRAPEDRVAALEAKGAEVVQLHEDDGRVSLTALLAYLGQREVVSVLVEGGGTLLGSFLDKGLVDKVVAFIAPMIIGGVTAKPAVGGQGSATISEALRLRDVRSELVGNDLMVVGYPHTTVRE